MRFSRTQAALSAALALASALPAVAQTPARTRNPPPTANPQLPNTTTFPPPADAPTLTPPGSITPIPLVGPGPSMTPGLNGIFSSSSTVPLTQRLGDLNGDWRRLTTTGTIDLGSITQVISSLLGSAGVGVYYTRGETVTLGNTTYLVTYRTQPKMLDLTSLMQMAQSTSAGSKPPAPEKLTPDTPLALTLLNLQSAGSLTDVRPFNLNTEITNSANAAKAFNDLMTMLGTLGPSLAPSLPKPPAAPKPHKRVSTT